LELAVVILYRDKVKTEHPIAWLYLGTIALNFLAGLVGLVDWLILRPKLEPLGKPVSSIYRVLAALFFVFVGILGVYGITARMGWPGTNGGIFPEVLSQFTIRGFGAFYLSISLGSLPVIWSRGLAPGLTYILAAYNLIVFITTAAFWNLALFDFAQRPGGLIYIGVYLVAGVVFLAILIRKGTGNLG
jgi:hypothetical protein